MLGHEATVEIVSNASRPDERRLTTSVGALMEDAAKARIANPAILLVRHNKTALTRTRQKALAC